MSLVDKIRGKRAEPVRIKNLPSSVVDRQHQLESELSEIQVIIQPYIVSGKYGSSISEVVESLVAELEQIRTRPVPSIADTLKPQEPIAPVTGEAKSVADLVEKCKQIVRSHRIELSMSCDPNTGNQQPELVGDPKRDICSKLDSLKTLTLPK